MARISSLHGFLLLRARAWTWTVDGIRSPALFLSCGDHLVDCSKSHTHTTHPSMDILKAEIAARKRKASNIEAEESGSKYVRRGEEIGERNEVERQQATDGNLSHPLKGRVEQVKDGAETQDSTGRVSDLCKLMILFKRC